MNAKEIEACAQAAERWPKGVNGGCYFSDAGKEREFKRSYPRKKMPEGGDDCC